MTSAEDIAGKVDWAAHKKRLVSLIVPKHIALLELSWNAERERLPVLGAFDLKDENVQKTIKTLGKRIVGISETTRQEVTTMLEQAIAGAGKIPGTDEIARRFREISELAPKDDTPEEKRRAARRARTISRTESQCAFSNGAFLSYEAAGVDKVECLDSDNDPECEARNGKIFTIDEARDIEPHPNCVLTWIPVID